MRQLIYRSYLDIATGLLVFLGTASVFAGAGLVAGGRVPGQHNLLIGRRGSRDGSPGMLVAAFRLALAAGIAMGFGVTARTQLLLWLPGLHVSTILLRTALLCTVGLAAYGILARLFGVRELAETG